MKQLFGLNKFILILISVVSFSSCQKVVNIDLNSSAPQIVIEGEVSDQPGPYTVVLTKTVNYDQSNTFPPVQGASVTINDDAGNSELLIEASPGVYKTINLQGVVGRTYTLNVVADNKDYQAVSKLNSPVNIDTLDAENASGFGGGGGGGGNSGPKSKVVIAKFTDPIGIVNYYRFMESINGITTTSINITSDNLRDGTLIEQRLRTNSDFKILPFDSVSIQLRSIDFGVFEYFRTFNRTGGGAFNSSTPANPSSNISNGALGYFSAYSVKSKSIVIQ